MKFVSWLLAAYRDLWRESALLGLAAGALSVLALASLARGAQNGLGLSLSARSLDLAPYWTGARLLSVGTNPYPAAISGTFWDHLPSDIAAMDPPFRGIPANAPLQLLLFQPLAQMDWGAARSVVVGLNLAAALAIPFLVTGMMKPALPGGRLLLVAVLFWGQLPTRNVIANGQMSLVVLAASLLAVRWAHGRPLVSGLALAVALVKYSLTLPLLAWFILFGWWTPILLAAGIHLGSVLLMTILTHSSLVSFVRSYGAMIVGVPGHHGRLDLLSFVEHLGLPPAFGWLLWAVVSLVTFAMILGTYRRIRGPSEVLSRRPGRRSLPLLAVLFSSGLLLVYHRGYDAVVLVIVLFAMWDVRKGLPRSAVSSTALRFYSWAPILVMGVFLFPDATIASLWPRWGSWLPIASGAAVILAWTGSIVALLRRLRTPADRSARPG